MHKTPRRRRRRWWTSRIPLTASSFAALGTHEAVEAASERPFLTINPDMDQSLRPAAAASTSTGLNTPSHKVLLADTFIHGGIDRGPDVTPSITEAILETDSFLVIPPHAYVHPDLLLIHE